MRALLDKNSLIKRDPVLCLLSFKLKMSPISIGVLFGLFSAILIFWAIFTDVWSSSLETKHYFLSSSFHTWAGNFVLAFANMLIVFFYLAFPKLIEKLYTSKSIDGKGESFISIYNSVFKPHRIKWIYIVVFLLSVEIAWLLQFLWLDDQIIGWTEKGVCGYMSPLGYYHFLFFVVQISIVFSFVINAVKIIELFRELEKNVSSGVLEYNVVRLCQYNLGGLKPISDIVKRIFWIFCLLGTYAAFLFFSVRKGVSNISWNAWSKAEMSAIGIYIFLALLILYHLVMPVRRFMKNKKEKLFHILIKQDKEVSTLHEDKVYKDFQCEETIGKLKFNDEIFTILDKIPTWPFSTKSVIQLISLIIVPTLPVIFDIIQKIF